jgi:hypothetical protein
VRKRTYFVAFVGLLLVAIFILAARTELALVEQSDATRGASAPAPVVFVCRNGVAMSVWSAAYFNRLAAERGLRERAVARASIASFTRVPFSMLFALALDGFRLDGYQPRVVDEEDTRSAARVIAIDIELPEKAHANRASVEVWDGFPPMREQYFPSRAALKTRVEALVDHLAADGAVAGTPAAVAERDE